MTSTRRGTRPTTALASAAVLVGLLLGGCSSSADSGDGSYSDVQGGGGNAGGDTAGEAADDDASGSSGSSGSTNEKRLVVQTGSVWVEADDPIATARSLVAYVEGVSGRVDSRSEQAASETDVAYARLTVRVPADKVSPTIDKLEELGRVSSTDLQVEDVTDAAEDLDARIHALELSVARMETLLQGAASTRELLEAESALSERQADLESLQSERARLQGRVSLSTLDVTISGPGTLESQEKESNDTFLSGLRSGWESLVTTLSVALVVLGAVLPWAAAAGLVVLVVVLVQRRGRGRWRSARPTPEEREPVTVGAVDPTSAGTPDTD